jgi:hypothetical protein
LAVAVAMKMTTKRCLSMKKPHAKETFIKHDTGRMKRFLTSTVRYEDPHPPLPCRRVQRVISSQHSTSTILTSPLSLTHVIFPHKVSLSLSLSLPPPPPLIFALVSFSPHAFFIIMHIFRKTCRRTKTNNHCTQSHRSEGRAFGVLVYL